MIEIMTFNVSLEVTFISVAFATRGTLIRAVFIFIMRSSVQFKPPLVSKFNLAYLTFVSRTVQECFRSMPNQMMFQGILGVADFAAVLAGVRAVENCFINVIGDVVSYYSVLCTVTSLEMDGHVRKIHLPVLEDSLADGALVVFVLEARLFVEVGVSLRGAEVFALAAADVAREQRGVQVRVVVVLAHV